MKKGYVRVYDSYLEMEKHGRLIVVWLVTYGLKKVTTSFGRINGGEFQEIHPCESLRIEIFPEADHVMSEDINLGGLELGMFERVKKYSDIELMDILYVDGNHPNQM